MNGEAASADPIRGRARRVRKNLRQGLALAWAASPQSLIRYSVLGMISSAMPPITVYLGAVLVNRIAEARQHALVWDDVLPIIVGLWVATGLQRAIGAYMGYGRNLFVRRVQLEAEWRLLQQASKVDLGHFDNSDWHDRLARAKRDVSWRPGDLTWSVLGLSGNIVTIVLMAGLLASLHWVLVVLALTAALLSLALERRVTSRLYEFFYKETPEEREREYLGDLLVQPRASRARPTSSACPIRPAPARTPGTASLSISSITATGRAISWKSCRGSTNICAARRRRRRRFRQTPRNRSPSPPVQRTRRKGTRFNNE